MSGQNFSIKLSYCLQLIAKKVFSTFIEKRKFPIHSKNFVFIFSIIRMTEKSNFCYHYYQILMVFLWISIRRIGKYSFSAIKPHFTVIHKIIKLNLWSYEVISAFSPYTNLHLCVSKQINKT